MVRGVLAVVGAVLLVAGTVFALQGFGVLEGSSMSNTSTWSVAGPIIAAVGLVLLVGALRSGGRRSSPRR